ncbi:ead/Ea22-like family protein [Salmonella enterica]|nr:ead/Ea22-like family protein [Salmonella enterica]ELS1743380.1 ead/Ea22-like family protein [Salmonella enterica]
MTALNKQALREAAEKVTALNFDTAEIKREDGCYECPACGGEGWIDGDVDYCNIDGVALGVLFYGIGEHHGLAEAYLRAANPATVLALMDELEAAEKRNAEINQRNSELVAKIEPMDRRIAELAHHLKSAHQFIEHTEAFGYMAASGILQCGDVKWDVDASKESLRAAGIGVKGK